MFIVLHCSLFAICLVMFSYNVYILLLCTHMSIYIYVYVYSAFVIIFGVNDRVSIIVYRFTVIGCAKRAGRRNRRKKANNTYY